MRVFEFDPSPPTGSFLPSFLSLQCPTPPPSEIFYLLFQWWKRNNVKALTAFLSEPPLITLFNFSSSLLPPPIHFFPNPNPFSPLKFVCFGGFSSYIPFPWSLIYRWCSLDSLLFFAVLHIYQYLSIFSFRKWWILETVGVCNPQVEVTIKSLIQGENPSLLSWTLQYPMIMAQSQPHTHHFSHTKSKTPLLSLILNSPTLLITITIWFGLDQD